MVKIASILGLVKNHICGGLNKKIVFLHIPKCGGTSLTSAIAARCRKFSFNGDQNVITLNARSSSDVIKLIEKTNYPHDTKDDFPILKLREKLLLYYLGFKNVDFISGHFPFSDAAYKNFSDQYVFMTILRDPAQRWVSSYFFNRFKRGDHRKVEDDIDRYLRTDFGRSQGYEMIKFLGGANRSGEYTSLKSIEQAKENLKKFDLVGVIEDMPKLGKDFNKVVGASINIEKRNLSPVDNTLKNKMLTEETMNKIKEICAPDYELYRYAQAHLYSS